MKKSNLFILFCVSLALSIPGFAAKDPKKSAIKARQGEMQLRSYNAGPLFAMAKGDITYDATRAQMLADNLVKLLDIDISSSWMQGTDNKAYPNDTTSLPRIWTTYPEIADYGKKYATAVRELAQDAGKGRDALRGRVGALGKSCKGCHDDFRQKK
jgi:cytochrome c556